MATAAKLGFGSKLYVEKTFGSGTYTSIAEVMDVKGPNISMPSIKTTNLDSPTVTVGGNVIPFHEFIGGVAEGGFLEFDCNFTKSQYSDFLSFLGNKKNWRLQLSDGSTSTSGSKFEFLGHVSDLGLEAPVEAQIKVPVKVQIDGAITFTQGT